ncbi:hypothetical protein F5Y16DRAFT_173228 [Xylariaceae sp. FL0255]|nr:hypothetical protein F5Y16DRAFT_173228 [Xylariaceae sp. FL0255]
MQCLSVLLSAMSCQRAATLEVAALCLRRRCDQCRPCGSIALAPAAVLAEPTSSETESEAAIGYSCMYILQLIHFTIGLRSLMGLHRPQPVLSSISIQTDNQTRGDKVNRSCEPS